MKKRQELNEQDLCNNESAQFNGHLESRRLKTAANLQTDSIKYQKKKHINNEERRE